MGHNVHQMARPSVSAVFIVTRMRKLLENHLIYPVSGKNIAGVGNNWSRQSGASGTHPPEAPGCRSPPVLPAES